MRGCRSSTTSPSCRAGTAWRGSASWSSSSSGTTSSTTSEHPDPAQYAERWNASISTVYKVLEEFRALFPGQTDPTAICQEIWDGVGAQQHEWPLGFVETMRVRVVPSAQAA